MPQNSMTSFLDDPKDNGYYWKGERSDIGKIVFLWQTIGKYLQKKLV